MLKAFSNNFKKIDEKIEEESCRSKYPELLNTNEQLFMAFKSIGEMGRDKTYLTNRRIIIKDGKGIGSARRNYLSVPYEKITSYSICSAGNFFDCDVEFRCTAKGNIKVSIDFAADKVSIFTIQQFMNDKVLQQKLVPDSTDRVFQDSPGQGSGNGVPTGGVEKMLNWLGDNAVELDARTVQDKFTTVYPVLLNDEKVHIAYKSGRDTTIISNKRFMVVDVKGWSGKRVKFETYPWSSIAAYSVETAGMWDRDTEIRVYTIIPSKYYIEQDLRNGKANLFGIQRALSDMILSTSDPIVPDTDYKAGHVGEKVKLLTWDGENNRPLDAVATNKQFHESPNILQPSEIVEMAFRGRRDMLLFTTRRLIVIDPKGITGKSIEYFSIPWKQIIAFAVRTAGKFLDLDSELVIWTNIMFDEKYGDNGENESEPGKSKIEFDFHKNKINVLDIQKYMSARICGWEAGVSIPSGQLTPAPDETGLTNLISRWGDDMKTIDTIELNREFHTTAPILLDGEDVTMAFRAGRDFTIFTNKRIISIDTTGLSGQKKRYLSIPYNTIRGFAVESAGGFDRDSELKVYTRNYWDLGKLNFDFRKGKADILAIQKFVASMVLENYKDATEYSAHEPGAILGKFDNNTLFSPMIDFLADDTKPDDPTLYEENLRSSTPILLSDEVIIRVFRSRRDRVIYTNKRYIYIDVKGISGKKVKYLSVPNIWFQSFAIETCGAVMDNEAEVYLHTECSLGVLEQDISVKYFDILKMHQVLSEFLFFDNNVKPKEGKSSTEESLEF